MHSSEEKTNRRKVRGISKYSPGDLSGCPLGLFIHFHFFTFTLHKHYSVKMLHSEGENSTALNFIFMVLIIYTIIVELIKYNIINYKIDENLT